MESIYQASGFIHDVDIHSATVVLDAPLAPIVVDECGYVSLGFIGMDSGANRVVGSHIWKRVKITVELEDAG